MRATTVALLLCGTFSACNCSDTQANKCAGVVCPAATSVCQTSIGCDAQTGKCAVSNQPDGTDCSDGNACNGVEACASGVCTAKAGTAITCDSPGACHTATGATCDPASGACSYPNVADGTSCSDGNACNGIETCTSGACAVQAGTAVSCDAPAACHTAAGATCDPASGACSYPVAPDGTACAIEASCNGAGACASGTCGCVQASQHIVVLAPGGAPIAGASVNGTTTGVSGAASFSFAVASRAVLAISAKGYAPATRVLDPVPAATYSDVVYLLPREQPISFDTGERVAAHGPLVNFYPEPPVDAANTPYESVMREVAVDLPDGLGDIGIGDLILTPIDPASSAGPCSFNGIPDGGTAPVPVQAASVAEIAFSFDGGPVDLAGNPMTMYLRLSAAAQGAYDAGDPCTPWELDGDGGVWRERSDLPGEVQIAKVQDSAGYGPSGLGILECRAPGDHSGWWGVMRTASPGHCAIVDVDGGTVGVHVATSAGVYGGSAGGCIDFAGSDPLVAFDDPSLGASVPLSDVPEGSCAQPAACVHAALTAQAAQGCVQGRVVDGAQQPVAGLRVSANGSAAITGADGTYCLSAQAGANVLVTAAQLDGGVLAQGSAAVAVAAGAAVCGGTSCAAASDLVLAPSAGSFCVRGRIWANQDGGLPRLPAAGQSVYVFDQDGGTVAPGCPDPDPNDGGISDTPPAQWASNGAALIGTATTGSDGRFCVDFPAAPAPENPPVQHTYVVAPGDCAIRRNGITDASARSFCALDPLIPDPLDLQRRCALENCIDIGDFDYGFLYDGSGCHR